MKDLTTELRNSKETVLLIDDDEMVTDVGERLLKSSGYDVVSAKTGKEALEVFRESHGRIDMVILDMILPDMGGGDTYDRLKEINPGINVLLVSGYDMDYQAEGIMECGCDGFIQKPFNMDILLKKTREILSIPNDHKVITLIIVGKHSKKISPILSDKQVEAETKRPERIPLDKFVYINKFKEK